MERKLLDMMNQLFISEYNSRVEYGAQFQFVCLSSGLIQMGRAAFTYIILCPCRCSGKGGSKRRSRPNSVFVTPSFSMQS